MPALHTYLPNQARILIISSLNSFLPGGYRLRKGDTKVPLSRPVDNQLVQSLSAATSTYYPSNKTKRAPLSLSLTTQYLYNQIDSKTHKWELQLHFRKDSTPNNC
jgi:hypothetical protein